MNPEREHNDALIEAQRHGGPWLLPWTVEEVPTQPDLRDIADRNGAWVARCASVAHAQLLVGLANAMHVEVGE